MADEHYHISLVVWKWDESWLYSITRSSNNIVFITESSSYIAIVEKFTK
jgi:hypothetical protein